MRGGRHVVDTSFFPSSSAVNPALTAIANAIRVGDHLLKRLGARMGTLEISGVEGTATNQPQEVAS